VDRAKRDEEARITFALLREPCIDAGQILVQHALEAARPCLGNLDAAQLFHDVGRLKPWRTPKRPGTDVHIGIANHGFIPFACRIGVRIRRRFSPRMSRLAASGTSAPCTLASCEAKPRPGTSLP